MGSEIRCHRLFNCPLVRHRSTVHPRMRDCVVSSSSSFLLAAAARSLGAAGSLCIGGNGIVSPKRHPPTHPLGGYTGQTHAASQVVWWCGVLVLPSRPTRREDGGRRTVKRHHLPDRSAAPLSLSLCLERIGMLTKHRHAPATGHRSARRRHGTGSRAEQSR